MTMAGKEKGTDCSQAQAQALTLALAPAEEPALSRASSVRTAFRQLIPSTPQFSRLSRQFSISPSSARVSRLFSKSGKRTADATDTMTTPGAPTVTPSTLRAIGLTPLSFRTSFFHPLDFDPVKTMEALESGELALPSPDTKHAEDNSRYGSMPHPHSPAASEASSDTIYPPKKEISRPDNYFSQDAEADELLTTTNSLHVSVPIYHRTNTLSGYNTGHPSTPVITPSKNNFSNLLSELKAKREDSKLKSRAASTLSQQPSFISVNHDRDRNLSILTPRKSSPNDDSRKASLKTFLSPRSSSANKSFNLATDFGRRSPVVPEDAQDAENPNELIGDIEFLRSHPAPDLSQHPMMANDPFTSHSAAPAMKSELNSTEMRDKIYDYYQKEKKAWREKQVRPFVKGEPFPVFRQPLWVTQEEERRAAQKAEAAKMTQQAGTADILASDASPLPSSSKTPKTPLFFDTRKATSPTTDIHVATGTANPLSDDFSRKSGSASIRNFSNLFKSRSSTGRSSLGSTREANSPEEKKEQSRAERERVLRITTNRPSIDHYPTSVYPRHPNTSRGWKSRNLRCAGCQWITCKVCGIACCGRAACFYGMENNIDAPEGYAYQRAKNILEAIERVIPCDTEVQTFLNCTTCNDLVCPDCCGMCPHEMCKDIQCRKCKPGDPWDECDWHRGQ